ncbi:MAG: S1/P1 nuclease [Pirellulales bacterium]
MNLRHRLTVIALFIGTLATPMASVAWNSPGHMIIALIAYDELDPAARAKAIELLRAHPRFSQHFQGEMPREVSRGDQGEKDQWVFAHAATWPDQVRDAKGGVNHQDVTDYNRPWWHFVNEPVFLNDQARRELSREIQVNRRREPPQDSDDKNMNIIQALKNSERIVRDNKESKEKRAVHLCWMMHLAGDSHQPLHAAALFTAHRFRAGDHGGNYVEYEHRWDLHAFWDEQISNDEPYDTLRVLATDLNDNKKLQEQAKDATRSLDGGQWINESAALAKEFGYTADVLEQIGAREGHSRLGPLELSKKYRDDAEAVAERRAMEAGYRLAKKIEGMLK